jgi:hypothetical protein
MYSFVIIGLTIYYCAKIQLLFQNDIIFSDLGTYKPGEWNVYSEIKRKLVEDHKISAHEIRFIQEAKTETALKAMIAAMNDTSCSARPKWERA